MDYWYWNETASIEQSKQGGAPEGVGVNVLVGVGVGVGVNEDAGVWVSVGVGVNETAVVGVGVWVSVGVGVKVGVTVGLGNKLLHNTTSNFSQFSPLTIFIPTADTFWNWLGKPIVIDGGTVCGIIELNTQLLP